MLRIYQSVFAVVVKNSAFLQDRIAAKKETHRLLFHRRASADRKVAQILCVVLVVSLLATSSPSAASTIAGWAREWRLSVASWTSSNSLPTKLFRSVADGYGRYENWLRAHALGRLSKTGSSVNAPQPAGHAAVSGSIPVVPSMIPLTPDAPPTFTDDPLQVGVTSVQALHITQLRDAVNLVRARAGLAAASWDPTFPVASSLPIKATHILELRTRLDEARTALGLPVASYSPPAPSVGGPIRAAHVQEIRDYIKAMLGTTASTDSAVARLDPANRTGGGGEDPLSRNYNWGVPLLSLPGRAGLDLGLSLSYNSLVWTKRGSSISFNDDGGFPSPGFRLGFPVIQPLYYNSEVSKYAFLLITPDGGHTELRQVNASGLYESADSSHLLLDTATMVLRTTDGSQLSYAWMGSDYQCTQVKDRNGNFITVNYTAFGRISTVVDTLGRVITFNYDGTNYLTSITQLWNGQSHTWASFEYYPAAEIHTDFSGLTVLGPQNGSTIKELSKVTLGDDSRFEFDYTYWGQIWKVRNHAADGHLLNYRAYNLPGGWQTPQNDCPRFTTRVDWAENWNRGGANGSSGLPAGPEQEVLTASWIVPASASWNLPDGTPQTGMMAQVTAADGTYNKIYFEGAAGTSTGWKRSLPSLVETYDNGNVRQRQSVTAWTQDDTALSYLLNPRVTETNVYDPAGNRARTTITYQTVTVGDGTSCKLPSDVVEFQANATTPLRRTHTAYNLDSAYTSRRIIGLVSEKTLFEVDPNTLAETLMSKVGFQYDETGSIQGTDAPVQHDNTNYAASFLTGRGNLSSVKRYDVSNTSQFTVSSVKYNTAGATVASIDPLSHQVNISYADSFSDNNNGRNTLAFPTTVTDPDNFSSTMQYNFDFGLVTRTQGPPPAGQAAGAIKNFTYDSRGRIQKVAIEFNGNADYSHTRFEYPLSQNRLDTYATIQEGLGEAHSFNIVDGHGRAIASASDHPGSTGGFSGQLVLYDNVGRAIKTSNPTETNTSGTPSQWVAAGDDATAGWLYTQQTYDWKGRPLVTTNTDGTTKEASYSGCGCAGGQVVTLTDEGTIDGGVPKRRQPKIYADILGRTIKTEVLNWQGGSVYSATVNVYNARDQVSSVKQYAGAAASDGSCPSGTCQQTTVTYDGYGRAKTKHTPEQNANTVTTYNYNADDTTSSVVDARGASQALSYNARRLVTGISYSAPSGIAPTAPVTYAYDAVGNRTSMTDGLGSVTYVYDQLSRLTSESRNFIGIGTFPLNYGYNLSGELTSVNDQAFSTAMGYSYDLAGRLSGVTGSGYPSVSQFASNMQYRAWGGLKSMSYGNGKTLSMGYNSRLMPSSYSVPGTISKTYQYYADARMDYSQDLGDPRYDRKSQYDQVGSLTAALSGAEARGLPATDDRPYNQTYQHDVWGNMTNRTGRQWGSNDFSELAVYADNRRNGWNYDASGNWLDEGTFNALQRKYDAAGRMVKIEHPAFPNNPKRTDDYDGDSQRLRSGYHQQGCSPEFSCPFEYTYYLRSTVLGGQIISEIRGNGQKAMGYVYYPSGAVIAVQKLATPEDVAAYVLWHHADPANVTVRASDVSGSSVGYLQDRYNAELDPLGADNALEDPGAMELYTPPDDFGTGWLLPSSAGGKCRLDGMPIDCSELANKMELGFVEAEYVMMARNSEVPKLHPVRRGSDAYRLTPRRFAIQSFGLGIFVTDIPVDQSDNEGRSVDWEKGFVNVPQNSTDQPKDNDPDTIQTANSNCGITINFQSGTHYPGHPDLPNGPSQIIGHFGLGFTVTGWVAGGGIGHIGADVNPENRAGTWTIDQQVNDWIAINGSVVRNDGAVSREDMSTNVAFYSASGNRFSWYDHPMGGGITVSRFTNFVVKAYNGNQGCQVEFHFTQQGRGPGDIIHWGQGLLH